MSGQVKVYITSITSSMEVRKQQSNIVDVLTGKKIDFKTIDVSPDRELLCNMREKCGDETAKPPQIFNGDQYCGNYDAFHDAVENSNINDFLKL